MSGNRKYVKYVFDEEPAGDVFYSTYGDPMFPKLKATEETTDYYEAKKDQGKVQPSLVPFESLEAVARIMTNALKENGGKYDRDSWRTVPDAQRRYTDALLRHVSDLMVSGNLLHVDGESGSFTIAHLATNAMILLALALQQDKENQE